MTTQELIDRVDQLLDGASEAEKEGNTGEAGSKLLEIGKLILNEQGEPDEVRADSAAQEETKTEGDEEPQAAADETPG